MCIEGRCTLLCNFRGTAARVRVHLIHLSGWATTTTGRTWPGCRLKGRPPSCWAAAHCAKCCRLLTVTGSTARRWQRRRQAAPSAHPGPAAQRLPVAGRACNCAMADPCLCCTAMKCAVITRVVYGSGSAPGLCLQHLRCCIVMPCCRWLSTAQDTHLTTASKTPQLAPQCGHGQPEARRCISRSASPCSSRDAVTPVRQQWPRWSHRMPRVHRAWSIMRRPGSTTAAAAAPAATRRQRQLWSHSMPCGASCPNH